MAFMRVVHSAVSACRGRPDSSIISINRPSPRGTRPRCFLLSYPRVRSLARGVTPSAIFLASLPGRLPSGGGNSPSLAGSTAPRRTLLLYARLISSITPCRGAVVFGAGERFTSSLTTSSPERPLRAGNMCRRRREQIRATRLKITRRSIRSALAQTQSTQKSARKASKLDGDLHRRSRRSSRSACAYRVPSARAPLPIQVLEPHTAPRVQLDLASERKKPPAGKDRHSAKPAEDARV